MALGVYWGVYPTLASVGRSSAREWNAGVTDDPDVRDIGMIAQQFDRLGDVQQPGIPVG